MRQFEPVTAAEIDELAAFLSAADLTVSGLDSPSVRLWVVRGESRGILGSTGFEVSDSGTDVLVRSVAVAPGSRERGIGAELARFAIDQARLNGAERAWLFSRRSGPFWQKLGFESADRDELADRLATTQQVRLFRESGQLLNESAWSRAL